MEPPRHTLLSNFQALRAVAAFLVLFVHIDLLVRPLGLSEHDLRFGNIGVDLFFVLSGFVIVHSVMLRSQSAAEFAYNRIVRVVPLYWVLTLAVFAVALVEPTLLNSTIASGSDLAKSLAFIPYRKANGLVQPVLFVGWTLNYEMFFYLAFASALALTGRIAGLAALFASTVLLVFVSAVQWTQPNLLILRFFGDTIVIEFVLGMWIALLTRRGIGWSTGFAVAMLVTAGGWLLASNIIVPEGPRWIFGGVPAAAILIAALALERRGRALSNPIVQLLGASSYALYLSHPFVLQGLGRLIEPINNAWLAIPATIAAIATAQVVGVGIHLWIEKPMMAVLGRRRAGEVQRPAHVETDRKMP